MLEVMRLKFIGIDVINYCLGEVENLPIKDNTIDYVFANMYVQHVESPPAAIKEIVRILKPDSKLVITDLDKHDFELLRRKQYDRWKGFQREDVACWLYAAGLG